MKLWSDSFNDGDPIPAEFAFGKHNAESNVELSSNKRPHFAWSDLPVNTKSLVMLCVDVSVPSKGDDVNQAGKVVPAELPRVDFYHWVLVDLPPEPAQLTPGEFSDGVTARGKSSPGPRNTRSGLNDYTGWFAGDAEMEGKYFGYDGPCPPWNDSLVHEYRFTLYATDLNHIPVEGEFTGADVLAAVEGHLLDQVMIRGSYHIYPGAKVSGA